ncbi:fatty acyl-CoA reductase 1-like protein [Leptotrombidium deliense]|uniref:Fatty acyl-CoA reductase n=1 Tax=Leptotrombidium deliense TaxID=299467 RepID=A0A443SD25_9ACAR|nr:fatty acyl-CoA reductase 1-like protein [Leptotrombidium deliense]
MCDTKRIDCVSHIKQFYSQKTLLITGCTGFIGKVILEKILHSCDDVGKIYILIRRKNGFSAESRVKKLLSSAPFTARNLKSSQLEKVIAIDGNIEEDNLGISDKSRQMLIDNVNVVIHIAASVRFNASFRSVLIFFQTNTLNESSIY